jgi:hypothetical protein
LFEDKSKTGHWVGLTGEYVRVKTLSDLNLSNRLVSVNITSSEEEHCIGQLIDTFSHGTISNTPTYSEVSQCV